MRLARVQLQMKQADAALKTLDSIKGEGWTAIVADLRGEILLSKGDKQGPCGVGSWREKAMLLLRSAK